MTSQNEGNYLFHSGPVTMLHFVYVGSVLLPNCHSAQHSNGDKQRLCQHKLGDCRASLTSHQKAGLIMLRTFGSNTSFTLMQDVRLVCFKATLSFQLKSDMPDRVTTVPMSTISITAFVLALQRAHHQQQQQLQQARAGQPIGMLSIPNLNGNPHASLKLGPGDRSTPSIMELDRQIASSDSGQNRNSPANSTAAAGSSLQVSICTALHGAVSIQSALLAATDLCSICHIAGRFVNIIGKVCVP